MNKETLKIKLENRIERLKASGRFNANLIKKAERKLRALDKK